VQITRYFAQRLIQLLLTHTGNFIELGTRRDKITRFKVF
jgi:hypothetical protein